MGAWSRPRPPSASSTTSPSKRFFLVLPIVSRISVPQASIDSHPSLHGSNHLTPSIIQFGKTRKLYVDRAEPTKHLLLEKHEFFHSKKAQLIAIMQHLAIFLYVIAHACICLGYL